jgi:hypothetical protein
MKRPGWIVLLIALNGCAAHRAPPPAVPEPVSSDWASVLALTRGTYVLVTLDADRVRRGFVWEATETALTIGEMTGGRTLAREAIARAEVARVMARREVAPKNSRRDLFVGIPIASAFVGGLTGMVIGGVQHDKGLARASGKMFLGSLMAAVLTNFLPQRMTTFENRIVYIRP